MLQRQLSSFSPDDRPGDVYENKAEGAPFLSGKWQGNARLRKNSYIYYSSIWGKARELPTPQQLDKCKISWFLPHHCFKKWQVFLLWPVDPLKELFWTFFYPLLFSLGWFPYFSLDWVKISLLNIFFRIRWERFFLCHFSSKFILFTKSNFKLENNNHPILHSFSSYMANWIFSTAFTSKEKI